MGEAQSIFIPKVSPGDLAALDYWTPNDAVVAGATPPPVTEERSGLPVLVYPDDIERGYTFMGSMGDDYGGGIITFDIFWIAAAATAGDVVWQIFLARFAPGDDFDAPPTGALKTIISPAPGTNGDIQKATIFFSNAEAAAISPADPFLVSVARLGTDGDDTMTDDAQFFRLNMKALP